LVWLYGGNVVARRSLRFIGLEVRCTWNVWGTIRRPWEQEQRKGRKEHVPLCRPTACQSDLAYSNVKYSLTELMKLDSRTF
jgi:hypothetical protein